MPDAQRGQSKGNVGILSRERFTAEHPARRMDSSCLKDLNYSKVFRNEFLKAKSGMRAAVYVIFF